jgi:hypothetical protein
MEVLARAIPAQTETSSSTKGAQESWKEQLVEPPLRDGALPPTCQGTAVDMADSEETSKRCGTRLGQVLMRARRLDGPLRYAVARAIES